MRMKLSAALLTAALLLALPAGASARSVLAPGELSVGAELLSDGVGAVRFGPPGFGGGKVSPSAGFLARYALSHDLALYGSLGFFHRFTKGGNPPAFYAVGGGVQYIPFSSKHASVLVRGGAQFIPRQGERGQELGFRIYGGPGVEAKLTDNFSLQFFTSFLDLQIGGGSTDFDIVVMPAVGAYLHF